MSLPLYDSKQFKEVYEPREDTFLFLDALELELKEIECVRPTSVIEIGSGSGLVINHLANCLGKSPLYFATDINVQACLATKSTGSLNGNLIECINTDLFSGFKVSFDIVLFNPPYVVTEKDELLGCGLNRAWAGGVNGREIIDKFLLDLPLYLNKNGICYMVVIEENNPLEIQAWLQELGFVVTIVIDKKILGEHLYVMKFTHHK